MIGYDIRSKGYCIYTRKNNAMISRTVKFIEEENKNEKNKNLNENQSKE